MKQNQLTYYAGLLSAAQYYGAAHHRPQQFQVLLEKNRRPIVCGKVRVMFAARKRIMEVPTRKFNTPRGEIRVSTPEATAVDLAQVEQDLVISKALVDIFKHPALNKALAFRGGTALYKLHIKPPARYSEDIDLVQVKAEPDPTG